MFAKLIHIIEDAKNDSKELRVGILISVGAMTAAMALTVWVCMK